MIKKAFSVAIILLILHGVFIYFFQPKHNQQNLWLENIIKAQNYLYNNSDGNQDLILGTSLSCRLIIDSLPGVYNMAFPGQSIIDGFSILSHKKQLPKNVFVEINVYIGSGNPNFIPTIFAPVNYHLKKLVPSLRDENQPIGILSYPLYKFKSKSPTVINNDLFTKMLQIKVTEYSELPSKALFNEYFNKLKSLAENLEKKGVHLIFYEMPVNKILRDLPRAKMGRDYFLKYFPISKYQYIPFPDSVEYKTSDGEHLGPEEALKYTKYFKLERALLIK